MRRAWCVWLLLSLLLNYQFPAWTRNATAAAQGQQITTSLSVPGGSPSSSVFTETYSYDGAGHLLSYQDACGPLHQYTTDGVGQVVQVPSTPVAGPHEVEQLQLSQTTTLDRQAFIATLGLTPLGGQSLDSLQLHLLITDPQGTDRSGDFTVIGPVQQGVSGQSIPACQATGPCGATSQWTLIPNLQAGGTDPRGTLYDVTAGYSYSCRRRLSSGSWALLLMATDPV